MSTTDTATTSEHFDVEAGDEVLVRVREHGDSGRLRGKFVATVEGFRSSVTTTENSRIVLDPPWSDGLTDSITLAYYDCEVEATDGEVTF